MKYKKDAVHNRGLKAIKRIKKYWLIGGIVSTCLSIAGVVEYLCIESIREQIELPNMIVGAVALLAFGVFAIVYSLIKKYDSLLEGCKDIGKSIKRAVRKYNRTNLKAAKSIAKETNSTVQYSQCSSSYQYDELFALLSKQDEVSYIGYPDTILLELKKENKLPSNNKHDKNHNFDPVFDDIEFFDLMDD